MMRPAASVVYGDLSPSQSASAVIASGDSPLRVMNRAGIYGWQTGGPVTPEQARRLDSKAKGFGQKYGDVSRCLIPVCILLVVVGILIAATRLAT